MTAPEEPVLLFDGDCAFCNGCVRWLLGHERRARYRFAPLQSAAARRLLEGHAVAPGDLGSLLVLDGGRLYRKSAAVLHLARELRAPWPALRILALLPRALRDAAYDYIGARRYRWWGRSVYCAAATPARRARFLASDR